MHKSNIVIGKPIKETNNGLINFSLTPLLVSTIMIIIIIAVGSYLIGLTTGRAEEKIDYSYYEKFKEYLIENSDAYDNCTDEFMKQEYKFWMNNTGYADIIINIDGELENAFGGIDNIVQTVDPSELSQGIYTFSDDEYSYTAIISMSDISEGDLVLVRFKLDSNHPTIFSTRFHIISENNYLIHGSKDLTLEFTEYDTIIIENSQCETYIDTYTLPNTFTGEYIPVHSF